MPPINGTVDVRLMNDTNALITYEVTGETGCQYLQVQEEATLQNISLPATITTVRQDAGLVDIISMQFAITKLSQTVPFDFTQETVWLRNENSIT